jgi:hypothetical protein
MVGPTYSPRICLTRTRVALACPSEAKSLVVARDVMA